MANGGELDVPGDKKVPQDRVDIFLIVPILRTLES
jgi:hypothetical protein